MQRGDCLPPGGFWLPGQSPSPTKPTVRALLQQLHGEEAHGLFIPRPCSSFDICWGGRKAPVTSPTCRGHCWEQGARVSGRLPTCPPALACPTPTTQEEQRAGGTEAGLEAGGSWGVQCPLPGQTCCFCPALITQVLEKSPEARTCPPSIPHHPKVFRVPFPQAAQSPFSQETGGLPGAAPSLGEGLPAPLSGEQQAWHHFWRRPGWGPSPGRHAEGPALGGLAPDCQRVRGLASSAVICCPGLLVRQRPLWRVLFQSPFAWEVVPIAAPWRTCGQDHSFSTEPWTGCPPRQGAERHRQRGHVGA